MEKKAFFSFRRGDVLAIALVVLLAVAVAIAYMAGNDPAQNQTVQIFRDQALIRELPLDVDAEFVVSGDYENTVVIRGGKVCIEESDCPGADCVHSGWIHQGGRSIVCLPNRVEIRISGRSDVDFVVG